MREILFRGKRKDNGEWVYGDLVHWWGRHNTKPDIQIYNNVQRFNVIPETVGQFTALTDKSGKKIFEGDILKIARLSDSTGNYYYPPHPFFANVVVEWDMCAWTWAAICEKKMYISFPEAWCHFECEVIGNTHDNPELLEVEQ